MRSPLTAVPTLRMRIWLLHRIMVQLINRILVAVSLRYQPVFHLSPELYSIQRSVLNKKYLNLARMSRNASTMRTKPPNVLVLSSGGRSSPEKNDVFCSIKDGLASCLDEERYVIYPLSLKDVVQAPWKDNCSLLVVPSGDTLSGECIDSEILTQLKIYGQKGGKLLSLHPITNASFGFKIPEQFPQGTLVEVTNIMPAWKDNATDGGNDQQIESAVALTASCGKDTTSLETCHTNLPPKISISLAQMKKMKFDDAGVETSTAVDCIQQLSFEESSGQAILSHVNLLSSANLNENTANISDLIALKRDTVKVTSVLRIVLHELGMECSRRESSSPTFSYLVCTDRLRLTFDSVMAPLVKNDVISGSEVDIVLIGTDSAREGSSVDPPPTPTVNKIVLHTRPSDEQLQELGFNTSQYTRWLNTGHLGRILLYTPVIGSTQTMLTGNMPFSLALKPEMGMVCAAGQQTQGRGRHANTWLSPKGCMMFSTALTVQPQSRLHSRLSLLQHIVALSVVSAIRNIPGYEELPVCIKWPNDIYYKNQVKLGGVLVTSFTAGSGSTPTTAIIGCGVNVCNKYPTMSVNDCIQLYNMQHCDGNSSTQLPPLTVEALLALTLNQLEKYLSLYEYNGMTTIKTDYYNYWLHSDAVVQLASRGDEEVKVTGISEYGYLCVRTHDGQELTLQPDGNSFDIMKNLIVMK